MKIDGTQTTDVVVDISVETLKRAVIRCEEISMSDMVSMVRMKFLDLVTGDDKLYIKDGKWYRQRRNMAGEQVAYAGHAASETEIEIMEAIEALDAVMVMGKLKGG